MAIVINGKTYRNLQEQVKKNMDDIEELKETPIVDAYSKAEADAKFVSKANLTDYSINDIIVADSEIQSGEVDLRAVSAQDVKSEVSLDPTSIIIKTTSGTNNSTIGVSGTEIDLTTTMLKYNQNEVATKNEIPTRTSDLINDSFVTTGSTQFVTASKIFKTAVDATIGATIYPSSGSFYAEKDGTSTSFAPQKISLSKSLSATPFNFQIHSSQGEGHSGVYTFDNSVTGTVTTKEYVDSTVGNKQDTLVSGTNIKTINGQPILGQGNISIGGSGTAGTGIDITNNVISVDTDVVVTKDANNNVDGILQVAHLESEDWDEDDDNKADIYLNSGLRFSSISLQTSGEESGSTLVLRGSTSTDSEGFIDLYGETKIYTKNPIKVYNTDVTPTTENTIAYISDLDSRKTHKYKFAINLGVYTEIFVRTFYADQGAYPTGTISDYSTAMTYLNIGDIFYNTEDSCIYTYGGAGQTIFMRKYDGTYYERDGQYPPVPAINITITQLD